VRLPLGRVLVHGPSMAPTLRSGDVLLVRWGVAAHRLRLGDVVVVQLPDRPLSVKRLVRRAGTTVAVYGDNPAGSTDSRELGPLPAAAIRGRVVCRLWPKPARIRGKVT
jgi:nickel-type superoxide dismutase maturation protease